MRGTIFIVTACLWLAGISAATAVESNMLRDFLVNQGCAIGPTTRALAMEAGFSEDEIDALLGLAEDDPDTVHTGNWVVLPPTLCTIRPPVVRSRISIDDTEVTELTSPIDAYVELGEHGCFIGPEIMDRVQETRGWDVETANQEYLRFLAENLANRTIAFYKNDNLSTPVGFQVLKGGCADVPEIEAIRRSQELRDREFDFLVRADAPNVICHTNDGPGYHFMEIVRERMGSENTNAWMSFEVMTMALGGGWYDGTSATEKGTPRPPLCRFP